MIKRTGLIAVFTALLLAAGPGAMAADAPPPPPVPEPPAILSDQNPQSLRGAMIFEPEPGFTRLFTGHDLAGWSGDPKFWTVQSGAIVGQTTVENPAPKNTFLLWTNGAVDDFELRFSYKVVPGDDRGFANSGVQYRSKVLDAATWSVGGYQADIEAGANYSGILYDEGGVAGKRGIMAARGERVRWDKDCQKQVTGSVGDSAKIQAAIRPADWNEYVVIARGNQLQHFINGHLTVDVTDDCEAQRLESGVLALQLHAGPPMTAQFKNLRIKSLKKSKKP
jgi:hypothetical protein